MSARRPAVRRGLHALAAALLAGVVLLAGQTAASAHVTAAADDPAAGGYTTITFRVPTESDTASTTGVEVHLPQDTPLTSVRVKPVPGWRAEVLEADLPSPVTTARGAMITKAPSIVRWTATDAGLGPDEFGEFEISAGPLPEEGTLQFPTVQSYSDGTRVDWAEQAEAGVEAEHPAPHVEIAAAVGGATDAHGSPQATTSDAGGATATADAHAEVAADGAHGAALPVAIIALVVAVLGSAAAVVLSLRRR